MKLMIEKHDKLVNGAQVDPKVVSVLLLGGVVNILSQSEAIEILEDRILSSESDNQTNNLRTNL